jgi:hypothetical protein
MPRTVRFYEICGAKLHGRPGHVCQGYPVKPGGRCKFHGGLSTGVNTPEGKAALAARNKLRAAQRQLRIARGGDPARGKPGPKPKGMKSIPSPSGGAAPPRAHDECPPWPPNGYRGGNDARRLEAREREFIRELNEAPLNLETLLVQRTGSSLSALSAVDVEQAATALVEAERLDVEKHLDFFTRAEAAWRAPGDGAGEMRLHRLQWEVDGYLKRLGTETVVLTLAAEGRERASLERAMTVSQLLVNGRDRAAYERAMRPRPRPSGPHSAAPWLRRP